MMKKLNYLFIGGLIAGFFTLASCGGDEPDTPPIDIVKERLSKTWAVDASNTASMVMFGTEDRTDAYSTFALTVTSDATGPSGSYSTTAVEELDPWPSSGTWSFTNPNAITDPNASNFSITRGDGVVMDVTLSETVLELQFAYDQNTNASDDDRVAQVDGNWTFVLIAQ